MTLNVRIFDQNFAPRVRDAPLIFRVNSFSHNALGGPREASISVRGPDAALWDVIGMLRCPVVIYSSEGQPVWWGYVYKTRVRSRGTEVSVSLGSMYNRIMAKYSYIEPGRNYYSNYETSWIQDAESVAYFGIKERRFSFSNLSSDAVMARLNRVLSEVRYPYPSMLASDAEESLSAHLECRGWWSTLLWRYYTQLAGEEAYTDTGTGVQAVGTPATPRVAQSFQRQSSEEWRAVTIAIRVRKVGNPTDAVRVILANSSYATLASGTIPASLLSTSYQWLLATLTPPTPLAGAVTYRVVVERTGSVDASNYYAVDVVEPPSYGPGVFTMWNGSSWVSRTPDADMPFKVSGERETTMQIRDILVSLGQFFGGVVIETPSGVFTNPFRNGEQTAAAYVKELLETATSNGRRLLAQVTPERVVRVYEEPDPAYAQFLLDRDRRISTFLNEPIPPVYTPCAVWVRMHNVLPDTIHGARLADASVAFIEDFEYDALVDAVSLTLRGARTIQDLGEIEQG